MSPRRLTGKAFSITGCLIAVTLMLSASQTRQKVEYSRAIYHNGWIDHNKNGTMDPYENPKVDVEARINDLLGRMTVEEKTMQLVTLYGFNRVLKDPLPTPAWKTSPWRDGIANIDEQCNGGRRLGI